MSRDEGFAVMDVSTSICDDPKFRRIARERPDLVGPAFMAYTGTMAESWRVGRKVGVDDAWPAVLPYDPEVRAILIRVGLLDRRGVMSSKAWRGWFEPAKTRRDKSRADWRRWQEKHRSDRGSQPVVSTDIHPDSDQDKSIPSVPTVRSSRTDRLDENVERDNAARRRPAIVVGYRPVEPSGRAS